MRSAAVLLLTLWGAPTLYYGDEIGMEDGEILPSQRQDPWNREGSGRDPERTPMQWDDSSNSGFCLAKVKPWLPVNPNYKRINVAFEKERQGSLLNLYKSLLHLRRKSIALNQGGIKFLNAPASVLVYLRRFEDDKILVIVNFEGRSKELNFSELGRQGELLVSTKFLSSGSVNLSKLQIGANESQVIKLGPE